MKLSLAKHGGQVAALNLRQAPKILDADALPKESAAELAQLVAAAKASPASKETGRGIAGDAMSYTITLENGGRSCVLVQSDTTMSSAFAALLDWLERH